MRFHFIYMALWTGYVYTVQACLVNKQVQVFVRPKNENRFN